MRGCSGGTCMATLGGGCVVAPGGHAWLLLGGMHGCLGGAWLLPGGHVWLLWGGMHGCSKGGACVVAPRGRAWDTTRYGDTVNEQAVRILLECILVFNIF